MGGSTRAGQVDPEASGHLLGCPLWKVARSPATQQHV
jgi:hypothetical protein